VDAEDFSILAVLLRDPRAAYAAVGEQVGLSGNSVKARLRRLEEDGVLQGFVAVPAPGVLGLRDGLLTFTGVEDAVEREEELLKGLAELPGVRSVDVALDQSVHARVLFRDESDWDRIERAAISLVGKPPALRVRDGAAPARVELAPADRRVALAILADGRLGLKDLSAASGLSFKTARKRLDALLARGLVHVEPVLSPAEARGAVLASAHVVLQPDAPLSLVQRNLPESVTLTGRPDGRLHVAHALKASLREARAGMAALAAVPGVERALPSLSSRRHGGAWMADALLARDVTAPLAPPPVPLARTRRG
jgi:Lrp/AsnC family leucine-responsive transcriptional regulator